MQARLPWHNVPSARVMIEITTKETILLPPNTKSIIHGYNEELTAQINVYSLEEIVAEKVRALLQFAKKLHECGWGRSRVRDYYDIWSILTQYGKEMDCSILPDLASKKCAAKGIEFKSFEDIFAQNLTENAVKEWDQWLGNLKIVKNSAEEVLRELRIRLEEIETQTPINYI